MDEDGDFGKVSHEDEVSSPKFRHWFLHRQGVMNMRRQVQNVDAASGTPFTNTTSTSISAL